MIRPSVGAAIAGAALFTAAGGFGTATVLSATSQAPEKTVTINLKNGATGPQGPPGPPGTPNCPTGFVHGNLVINHPGGQVTIFTCIKGD